MSLRTLNLPSSQASATLQSSVHCCAALYMLFSNRRLLFASQGRSAAFPSRSWASTASLRIRAKSRERVVVCSAFQLPSEDEVLEQLKLKGTKGVLLRNYLGLLRQLQETKELELEAKDRELEAISAVKDRDLLAKEFELQRVTANLLLLRGKLHARGLIEYAEEQLRLRYNLPWLSRVDLWSKISENASGDAEVEELVACISASSGWPRTVIAKEVAHLYKQLSGDIHDVGLYQQSAMAVDLAVPPLQPKQAGLLQCIARITGVAVNIVYYTPAGEDGA